MRPTSVRRAARGLRRAWGRSLIKAAVNVAACAGARRARHGASRRRRATAVLRSLRWSGWADHCSAAALLRPSNQLLPGSSWCAPSRPTTNTAVPMGHSAARAVLLMVWLLSVCPPRPLADGPCHLAAGAAAAVCTPREQARLPGPGSCFPAVAAQYRSQHSADSFTSASYPTFIVPPRCCRVDAAPGAAPARRRDRAVAGGARQEVQLREDGVPVRRPRGRGSHACVPDRPWRWGRVRPPLCPCTSAGSRSPLVRPVHASCAIRP
jgi:hypothetical protein